MIVTFSPSYKPRVPSSTLDEIVIPIHGLNDAQIDEMLKAAIEEGIIKFRVSFDHSHELRLTRVWE